MFFYLVLLVLNFFSRRVFIDVLGVDIVGMTASMQSYIGMLNIAELGIGTAVAAVLYAPIHRNDTGTITEIVSILGYFGRVIAIVIAASGVILSLFLPLLFAAEEVAVWVLYLTFYTFLVTTVLSYVVNYKQILLIANQKNYIPVTIFNTTLIAKTILQILLLRYFGFGLKMWLALELVTAGAYAVWLEVRINREYPWLRSNVRQGRAYLKRYPDIIRKIKQITSHRVSSFVLNQSDPIVIQLIMGVEMVTYYTNYTMIINRLLQFSTGALSSNTAGVGNLVAQGDKKKIELVFWQLNALYMWLGGVIGFCLYTFITPLIRLWLPPTVEIFSDTVVLVFTLNMILTFAHQPLLQFTVGYGLFADWIAGWIFVGLNVVISVVVGLLYGVVGIVLGTLVSTFLVLILWRSHYLYTRGFGEKSAVRYYLALAKYLLLLAVTWGGGTFVNSLLPPVVSWVQLIINGAIILPAVALIYGGLLLFADGGMRTLVQVVLRGNYRSKH